MEKFTFDSAVRGYHIYKVVWKPTIGEKLQVDQELGNKADKFALKVVKNNEFAMKVVKNNEIVGNLRREYSVFYRTWRARIADKHTKTQTTPFGAIHEKVHN